MGAELNASSGKNVIAKLLEHVQVKICIGLIY